MLGSVIKGALDPVLLKDSMSAHLADGVSAYKREKKCLIGIIHIHANVANEYAFFQSIFRGVSSYLGFGTNEI